VNAGIYDPRQDDPAHVVDRTSHGQVVEIEDANDPAGANVNRRWTRAARRHHTAAADDQVGQEHDQRPRRFNSIFS
jgi:hypothetical protein